MDLRSYDRLFPNQDVMPDGGFGNLIAAPMQGRRRMNGLTLFLDLASLEPHADQWAYLSTIDRLSPAEAERLARRLGPDTAGTQVTAVGRSSATSMHPPLPRSSGRRSAPRSSTAKPSPSSGATGSNSSSVCAPVSSAAVARS
ncbi:MAG: hypothetical protein Q4G51_03130 [Dermatophilus congolensis]|nr:hypothetical protein [Dermatophilus congolensis]